MPRIDSSLLPRLRNVRITYKQATLNEALVQRHDACLAICPRDNTAEAIKRLPFSASWAAVLSQTSGSKEKPETLHARVGPKAIPMLLWCFDRKASAFAQLTSAARAWKSIGTPGAEHVLIIVQDATAAIVERALAAVLAATAPMPNYKSKPAATKELQEITIVGLADELGTDRVLATDTGNHLARWLTSLPPNVLNTTTYTAALRQLAQREGWTFKHHSHAALRRMGAGAFTAVTQASPNDSGLVHLRYRPKKPASETLALVGKGVCFDTGGINLKPHKSMYQMHEDMQGSAVAVGTLLALTRLKVPYQVDCWLALAENDIGPLAYRPQDVVTALNGVTIQVVHSDAEGRMLLADTLALAAREKPAAIIDYATLTGACVYSLTERYSGVFTNRGDLHPLLTQAGVASGERVWPFPMDEDFDGDLETPMADVLQCTMDGKGDHIFGARFLRRFVPDEIPWIHVDLSAGSNKGGLAHIPTDFTGFGVRWTLDALLDQDLLRHARTQKKQP